MPYPLPPGRPASRASPARGAGSSAPPGRWPPRRCSRSPARSPCRRSPPPAHAQTTCTLNTGDIWCGVVTVGNAGAGNYGFTSGGVGGLTDNSGDRTFTIGTVVHSVDRVIVSSFGLSFKVLRAADGGLNVPTLLDDDRARLVLHIGSDSFAFSDATHNSTLGYEWTNPVLDWSSTSSVTLRLREAAAPPAPTNFTATVGNAQVALAWDAPQPDSGVTRHEYHYKTDGGYPATWTAIANSAVGGANQAGFTVTGLTNEKAHTFELRAVNAVGNGEEEEAGPVTPTPGICDRTQIVHEIIVYYATGVDNCAAVTVADLAGFTSLDMSNGNIASLKPGDFAGLTSVTVLNLSLNSFTTLSAGVFSGLTVLETLQLHSGQLSSLSAGVFSGLTALETLRLSNNKLNELPDGLLSGLTALTRLNLENNALSSLLAGVFTGLSALETLRLHDNALSSLDAGVFTGLSALETLSLYNNQLSMLPGTVFTGLTALTDLSLDNNQLNALPAGVFTGLTALTDLALGGNAADPLPLTVTVEKVGTDQARAKVLAGAPFAVDIPVTVVDGTSVTVTRTAGTTAAVTVDVDLTTQPTLPANHTGYTFVKSTSGLPATILPAEGTPDAPTNFTVAPGDGQVVLSWDAPASDSGVTRHEYHYKTSGGYPATWTVIANSAVGEANEAAFTVPMLTNEVAHTFELRAVTAVGNGEEATARPVTPTPGICDRTQQVQDEILRRLTDVSDCAAVTVADLATVTGLELEDKSITSLKADDFAGLTAVTYINLSVNTLGSLPANLFSGLSKLQTLYLNNTELTSLSATAFSGLTALVALNLGESSLPGPLPANLFFGLTSLRDLDLYSNGMTRLPAGLFSGLSGLAHLNISGNAVTALPAGVFSGLSKLRTLYLGLNKLTTLPAGVFSGLTALTTLDLSSNTADPLPLTVTVENVAGDRVRAKVLAGAPFAVEIPVTVVDGTLAGGATALGVAAGSVEGTAVTVTRTAGTTAAVTVDVDLSTQPTLPTGHTGYTFVKSTSGLPATVLPAAATLPIPTGLMATAGDARVMLAWDAPAPDSGVTHHEFRFKTDGSYGNWTPIANSGPGETNASGFTVTRLANGTAHTFELRAHSSGGNSLAATSAAVTPTGPPRIDGVAVTSSPGLEDDTYGLGERIRITVTFDQAVLVVGDPEFGLDVGGPHLAGYESGSGTDRLVFVYTVQPDDSDGDGIWIGNHNHADNRTLRLDGNDRITNATGDADAELAHDVLGGQSGHKVDGSRQGGTHSHPEFNHTHAHFNSDKGYYTQEYDDHTHASHVHGDLDNGHSSGMRPGQHHHHEQPEPRLDVFLGPDLLRHDAVPHTHVCRDIEPECIWGDNFNKRGGSLGLPIRVTHAHPNSEPGHDFDWKTYFDELEEPAPEPTPTPTPAGLTATPGNARVTLAWNAPAPDLGVTHHEYRYKTSGDYPAAWRRIANSAPGGTNASGLTVNRLANGTAYTFELRAGGADGDSAAATSDTVTPMTPPRITGVAVTSAPVLDGNTYGAGDDIRITATFDQPVQVEGDPEFGLDVGGPRLAGYRTGSGTDRLVFVYTVQSGDRDSNGIWIGNDIHPGNPTFRLDGDDSIGNATGHQDANLAHGALGTQRGHKADGLRESGAHSHPEFTHTHAHFNSDNGYYTQEYADHTHPHHVHDDTDNGHPSGMRPGQHHHHEQPEPRPDVFLGPDILRHDHVPHTHVCRDIEPACIEGENFNHLGGSLGLPKRVTHSHANSEPGHRYDWAAYFERGGPALMARFESMPAQHDGTKRITARVTFSEPIDASEEEMGEHGVQVEGGRVRSARRAPPDGNGDGAGTRTARSTRTTKDETTTPSGEGSCGEPGSTCTEDGKAVWEFEIEPGSDGDVTLRIDGGRPCDEPGAICTADGRSLSEGISTTVEGPETGPPPLTASFEEVPEAHDGEDAFRFRVAFSEDIRIGYRNLRDHSFTVSGGAVTGARRVDGRHDLWEITVEPGSDEAMTITLPAGRECAVSGAICTRGENRRQLTNTPTATVAGPLDDAPGPNTAAAGAPTIGGTPQVGEELSASTSGISDADGLDNASFAYQWIRTGVDIGGATASTYTPVAADEGERLKVRVGFTDDAGHEESLTSAATDAVAAAATTAAPLTARFAQAPAEHDGSSPFKLRIGFSEGISIGFRTFRDQSLSAVGGSVTGANRVDGRKDLWQVTVKPGSLGEVTVTLEGGRACGTAGAVCTGDGRALSATISTTVLGPVALSVADARVREASDVTLDFAVTLSRASRATVAVAYATADGSATAGSDYTARKGELTFAPGETAKTVSVPVLDDAHDEGEETLTLRLSAASGAVIADGVATGTIENTDHMPQAWLARFGRTVTDQVLEAVEARLAAPRAAGVRATLAGQALPSWDGANDNAKAAAGDNADASDRTLAARDREAMTAIRDWMAHAGADGDGRVPGEGAQRADLAQSRALTGRDFLTGTSFALTGGSAEAGGYAALWGRGAITRFDGREGELTLDGEVTTALMGADWAAERWTAGLAVGHARGTGGYSEGNCDPAANVTDADTDDPDYPGLSGCSGELEATLTGVWPYAGLKLTDRVSAWAAAGYGAGEAQAHARGRESLHGRSHDGHGRGRDAGARC